MALGRPATAIDDLGDEVRAPVQSPPRIEPGDKVPRTGLYQVRKGTRIIPVKQVRKMERKGRR